MTKGLIGEKVKWTNKGNDKQQHADSLFHNTTSRTQKFVPNFKILGAVVPEKSLTQRISMIMAASLPKSQIRQNL